MRGGWVGSDVWDKVPKNRFFFTPSLIALDNCWCPYHRASLEFNRSARCMIADIAEDPNVTKCHAIFLLKHQHQHLNSI